MWQEVNVRVTPISARWRSNLLMCAERWCKIKLMRTEPSSACVCVAGPFISVWRKRKSPNCLIQRGFVSSSAQLHTPLRRSIHWLIRWPAHILLIWSFSSAMQVVKMIESKEGRKKKDRTWEKWCVPYSFVWCFCEVFVPWSHNSTTWSLLVLSSTLYIVPDWRTGRRESQALQYTLCFSGKETDSQLSGSNLYMNT